MTAFLASVAALTVVALLVLLAPLLGIGRKGGRVSRSALNIAVYRDQLADLDAELRAGNLSSAEHDKARRELEARLLEDVDTTTAEAPKAGGRWAAVVVGLAVPVLALGVYGVVGDPQTLIASGTTEQTLPAHGVTQEKLQAMVAKLATHMRQHPDDARGWILLGRSYAALGHFYASVNAYANAVKLRPRDAELLVDYANVLAYAQGRRFIGEPEVLIARALKIDPDNLRALAIAGTAAFERADYKSAAAYWRRMLPLVPAGSKAAKKIQAGVDLARSRAGEPAAPASSKTPMPSR